MDGEVTLAPFSVRVGRRALGSMAAANEGGTVKAHGVAEEGEAMAVTQSICGRKAHRG